MSKKSKIIVIGGNAAGPAAAAKAKRTNPESDVLMIEAGEFISTGTCEIPYAISGEVPDYKKIIYFSPEKFYEKKNVKVLIKHFVEKIDRNKKNILVRNLNDNSSFELNYDKLIITTGALPNKLPDIHPDTANHFNLKSVSDLISIKNYLDKNEVRKVVIFGAGYIGLETAETFKKLKKEVVLIDKAELPMPLSEVETQNLVKNIIEQNGVEFYGGVANTKINYTGNKIKSVNIDGRIVECDLVVSSIGFKPNTQLALSSGIKTGNLGGIKVDRKLRTNDPDIYAAGDCIEIINHVTNQNDYIPLATLAHEQGHLAGANAAGENNTLEPAVKNSAVRIFNKTLVSVGISGSKAAEQGILYSEIHKLAPNLVPVMPESEKTFGKIIYEKKNLRILGAEFFGNDEVISYGDLVAALIKINESVKLLSRVNFNYTPPKSPFINILSMLGREAT